MRHPVQVLGIGLSALALAALLVMLLEVAGRRRLRVLGRPLAGWKGVAVRAALGLGSLGTFVAGAFGLPLAADETARRTGAVEARAVSTTWRLPFYVEARTRSLTATGAPAGERVRRTLQLPWPFLAWLAFYAAVTRRGRSRRPSDGAPPGSGEARRAGAASR